MACSRLACAAMVSRSVSVQVTSASRAAICRCSAVVPPNNAGHQMHQGTQAEGGDRPPGHRQHQCRDADAAQDPAGQRRRPDRCRPTACEAGRWPGRVHHDTPDPGDQQPQRAADAGAEQDRNPHRSRSHHRPPNAKTVAVSSYPAAWQVPVPFCRERRTRRPGSRARRPGRVRRSGWTRPGRRGRRRPPAPRSRTAGRPGPGSSR